MQAEEFIRRHATKVVAGAIGSSVNDMTPHATAQAQAIARRTGVIEPVVSFDVTPAPAERVTAFDVTYHSMGGRSLTLRETLEDTPDGWRIAGVSRVRGHRRI